MIVYWHLGEVLESPVLYRERCRVMSVSALPVINQRTPPINEYD